MNNVFNHESNKLNNAFDYLWNKVNNLIDNENNKVNNILCKKYAHFELKNHVSYQIRLPEC